VSTTNASDSSEQLLGRWSFAAMSVVNVDTGAETPAFDHAPHGYLIFHPDRMFAFIKMGPWRGAPPRTESAAGEGAQPPPTPPPRSSIMAYSGPWVITDDFFTTTVDMASIDAWVGTEQKRFFKLDGDRLEITTVPQQRPSGGPLMHGRLIWQRDKSR